MLHNKIRYLLALRGLHMSDYAKCLNRSRQSISVKFKNESFSMTDLVNIAEMTRSRIAFIDEDNGRILMEITRDDLPEKGKCFDAEQLISNEVITQDYPENSWFIAKNARNR